MKHYIELFGKNGEALGKIESDEKATFEESLDNLQDKIADHMINNEITYIQIAFGGIVEGTILSNNWAAAQVRQAVLRHADRFEELRDKLHEGRRE